MTWWGWVIWGFSLVPPVWGAFKWGRSRGRYEMELCYLALLRESGGNPAKLLALLNARLRAIGTDNVP